MSRASAEKGERDWGRMDGRDMDIGAQVLRIGTGEEEQSLHERERTSSLVRSSTVGGEEEEPPIGEIGIVEILLFP